MATVFSHAVAGVALGGLYVTAQSLTAGASNPVFSQSQSLGQSMAGRFWMLTVICAILPDLDVIGYGFGVPYRSVWGHRGVTHSLLFAVGLGVIATFAFPQAQRFSPAWWSLATYFFAVTASHGVLDAMTNGGLGIAFFVPFDTGRYFLPWRPVEVSPIGISAFFSARAVTVLKSELIWIWTPSFAVLLALAAVRRYWQP
jgi:inner membrane protein